MSFPAYSDYKDSGVPWLGEVPRHWEVVQGRRQFRQVREPSREGDEQLSASQKYGVVPQVLLMKLEDQKVVLALKGLEGFKQVDPDDFVISLRSFQGGIEHSAYSGCVSPAYTVLRPARHQVARFFTYVLKSRPYISALQAVTDGIRDGKSISFEQFGQVGLPIPSLHEQASIAAFLDRETAKIDALVAEQERLIALLKEKRQAVISHAVTKGLNPNAPMKDSGIEWLGEIPAHWNVSKIKFATSHVVDCLHTTPTYDGELLYPAIRTADIDRGVLLLSHARLVSQEIYDERIQRLRPQAGDVLYSREGERFGMAALVPAGTDLCLGQRMMMFRCNNEYESGFLMWALNSDSVYQQVIADLGGATSPHVNISDVVNFAIPRPPKREQVVVAAEVTQRTAQLDALVVEAQTAITLLQERRAVLISAAVTGKIDVRGVVEPVREHELA